MSSLCHDVSLKWLLVISKAWLLPGHRNWIQHFCKDTAITLGTLGLPRAADRHAFQCVSRAAQILP